MQCCYCADTKIDQQNEIVTNQKKVVTNSYKNDIIIEENEEEGNIQKTNNQEFNACHKQHNKLKSNGNILRLRLTRTTSQPVPETNTLQFEKTSSVKSTRYNDIIEKSKSFQQFHQ